MTRPDYEAALATSGLMTLLAPFDPHVAGTPPLRLDLPTSDIDILCHAPEPGRLADLLWQTCRHLPDFAMRQWTGSGRPIVAGFTAFGWPFEIFGATQPVAEQAGWRHFDVERRLLDLGGDAFRDAVMQRRRAGMKTEPAFADALGLNGDPYAALLSIDGNALSHLLQRAGFSACAAPRR